MDLQHKRVIAIGEREGVQGDVLRDVVTGLGAGGRRSPAAGVARQVDGSTFPLEGLQVDDDPPDRSKDWAERSSGHALAGAREQGWRQPR
jgi:hypothetical protein